MKTTSGIYRGSVVHERVRPRHHRIRYGVFSMLLDLNDLANLSNCHKLLAYNSKAFFSIRDEDHGDGSNIKDWVESVLLDAGLSEANHQVMMLCYPRILGFVFNPLTVFFCYRQNGSLRAIIYEVHNTFRERHWYILPVTNNSANIIKQKCKKELYVSPFVPMDCTYNFFIQPPGDRVRVVIREEDSEGLLLAAAFSGNYSPLNDLTLFKAALRYPLMTVKVIAGIHFEAIRLFFKGIPNFPHSAADEKPNTKSALNNIN